MAGSFAAESDASPARVAHDQLTTQDVAGVGW
eukprot:SAG31_NODE_552_length_14204_cov_14.295356_9_plen_32_part_00